MEHFFIIEKIEININVKMTIRRIDLIVSVDVPEQSVVNMKWRHAVLWWCMRQKKKRNEFDYGDDNGCVIWYPIWMRAKSERFW